MDQLTFPDCVIPGCPAPVGLWGDVCGDCRVAFGGFLRLDGDPLTQAQIEERDRGVRAAYAIQREVMAGG